MMILLTQSNLDKSWQYVWSMFQNPIYKYFFGGHPSVRSIRSRVTGAKAYCTDPKRHATHTRPGPQLDGLEGLQVQTPNSLALAHQLRTNVYDNIVEYWVTVREHGAYEEEHEILEERSRLGRPHFLVLHFDKQFCILFQNYLLEFLSVETMETMVLESIPHEQSLTGRWGCRDFPRYFWPSPSPNGSRSPWWGGWCEQGIARWKSCWGGVASPNKYDVWTTFEKLNLPIFARRTKRTSSDSWTPSLPNPRSWRDLWRTWGTIMRMTPRSSNMFKIRTVDIYSSLLT